MPGVNMHLLLGYCTDMIKMDYTYIFYSPPLCTSIIHITSCNNVAELLDHLIDILLQFPFCFFDFFYMNVCTTPSLLWYCAFLNVFFVKLLWWLIIFLIKMGFH